MNKYIDDGKEKISEHKTMYKDYQIKYQIDTSLFPALGTPAMQTPTKSTFPYYKRLKATHQPAFQY